MFGLRPQVAARGPGDRGPPRRPVTAICFQRRRASRKGTLARLAVGERSAALHLSRRKNVPHPCRVT
eukprot:8417548-Pyramimonas_sp.AAC.1